MNIMLAHFELLEEIGHGGLGIVFRAFDPSLNRNVAIKVLKDEFAQDPQFVQDFLRESQNAAAISHPHIAQVHFVGEHEDNYYMVMELVNGRSLEQIVKEDGPLPEAKALRAAIEITEALKAGYVNQMIHGDIKPQNIVVGQECGAKLLDFGLAQLANVEANATEAIWGSPYYISPERVGRKAEDFRSDIYSLGATLFEALVGHPPFEAEDPAELALKRLHEKPPLLRTLNPNISKRTEQIIDKMLHKNLLMRYLDYDSLLKELRKAEAAALGREPLADTMELRRATGYITAPVPVATRSLLPTIIAVSLATCLLVGGFIYFLADKKTALQATPPPTAVVSASNPLPLKSDSKGVQSPAEPKPAPLSSSTPGTYLLQDGSSPWLDGPKWAFFNLSPALTGTTPLPKQKWGRNLAVPGSPVSITIGVAKDAAADFLSAYPTASPTGEIFYVKNPEGLIHLFNIFKMANPPQSMQFQSKIAFGIVLLKSEGTTLLARLQPVPQNITADTFTVQLGSAPWVDGSKWVFYKIPAGLVGSAPLPQMKWDARSLTLLGSPASVTIAVAKDAAADFLSAYPTASPTGEQVELKNQKGEIHPFTVFKVANPPQTLHYKSTVPFSIIPLKM